MQTELVEEHDSGRQGDERHDRPPPVHEGHRRGEGDDDQVDGQEPQRLGGELTGEVHRGLVQVGAPEDGGGEQPDPAKSIVGRSSRAVRVRR
ncbi:MAG: hypothetical protein R2726_20270 [Acidimicrobiales bacterium]